jgi:Holliday junction resolvase-like predicted endonuclease
MKAFHVGVAAEAFAAALFAQAGWDVSVQYGANQPEYDLLVSKGNRIVKVSVKGSQDGGWGLVQKYKKGRTYSEAIAHWLSLQPRKLVYCLVQFKDVELGQCPRVFLATPREIAKAMAASRAEAGNTTLREHWSYTRGVAKGISDSIPKSWQFSNARISRLFQNVA